MRRAGRLQVLLANSLGVVWEVLKFWDDMISLLSCLLLRMRFTARGKDRLLLSWLLRLLLKLLLLLLLLLLVIVEMDHARRSRLGGSLSTTKIRSD